MLGTLTPGRAELREHNNPDLRDFLSTSFPSTPQRLHFNTTTCIVTNFPSLGDGIMAGNKREATHQGRKEDPDSIYQDDNDAPQRATAAQMAARKYDHLLPSPVGAFVLVQLLTVFLSS